MDFWNNRRMLNASAGHPQDVDENSFLYTFQYLLKNPDQMQVSTDMAIWLNEMFDEGWYNQIIINDRTHDHDRYTSHDQLTSYCLFSYLTGRDHHRIIWDTLKSHWFTYDNVSRKTNFERVVHPRDILFIGILNDSYICMLLYPLLGLTALYTFIRHYKRRHGRKIVKTDGELLWWCRFQVFSMPKLEKICNALIEIRFGNWDNVFETYYPVGHPNRDKQSAP